MVQQDVSEPLIQVFVSKIYYMNVLILFDSQFALCQFAEQKILYFFHPTMGSPGEDGTTIGSFKGGGTIMNSPQWGDSTRMGSIGGVIQ